MQTCGNNSSSPLPLQDQGRTIAFTQIIWQMHPSVASVASYYILNCSGNDVTEFGTICFVQPSAKFNDREVTENLLSWIWPASYD